MSSRPGLLALAAALAWACRPENVGLALVEVRPGSLSACAEVVLSPDGGTLQRSAPLATRPGQQLAVAIFAGSPDESARVWANGYASAGCQGAPDEVSAPADVQFGHLGSGPELLLVLEGEGSCTDGIDGDRDGLVDCLDQACAGDAACAGAGPGGSAFPYVPSNFSLAQVPPPDAGCP